MQLSQIMQGVNYTLLTGQINLDIKGISYDSRKVAPGELFICIPGQKTDGHIYAEQALQKGAAALLVEKDIDIQGEATVLLTSDCRKVMSIAATNYYINPSRSIKVIGVTGTNGKTTTTHIIQAILEEQGAKVGIMGTLYARFRDYEEVQKNTTPESLDIQKFMSLVREEQGDYLVMEVSSHAIDLGRVDGIFFHAAVFTNLTQDHLDYHQTMEKYKASKLKLFTGLSPQQGQFAIINVDDPVADDFIKASGDDCLGYGIAKKADVQAVELQSTLKGSQFRVLYREGSFDINMNLIGRFNVYNALAAIAFALQEGVKPAVIKKALQNVSVPGRFEQVDCGQDFTVIVDYAHTPDGLENILRTGREILEKRLITVFGCGGDRDKGKRPLMGKIAAQYSDFCLVTSDNPRSEEPERIIDDIIPGILEVEESHYAKIIDRREAIHQAICLAQKGDLVIIAGKGHETYQLINDQVLDFDDRKVAAEFLKGRVRA